MPWCPKCGAEYREGISKCHECNVSLTYTRPRQPDIAINSDHSNWQILVNAAARIEADIVKGLLESNGIPVRIIIEGNNLPFEAYGYQAGAGANIFVPKEHFHEAKLVLEEYKEKD